VQSSLRYHSSVIVVIAVFAVLVAVPETVVLVVVPVVVIVVHSGESEPFAPVVVVVSVAAPDAVALVRVDSFDPAVLRASAVRLHVTKRRIPSS